MTSFRTLSVLTLAAGIALVSAVAPSEAGGRGKEHYSETYHFDRAMNGYEGFSGAYHCSYIKTPKKVCLNGKCKTVWELVQTCQ